MTQTSKPAIIQKLTHQLKGIELEKIITKGGKGGGGGH